MTSSDRSRSRRTSAADSTPVTRRRALKAIGVAGFAGVGVAGRTAAQDQQGPPPWLAARDAVVRIEAFGTYDFPDFGDFELAAWGTGFIIDPSGIAVTANHVVTGAATLEVFVGDDDDESFNASFVGSSECSDLAVIDIRGNDFPSLSFASASAGAGTEVYTHGFPVNSERMSTTNGIVSRTDVSGESNWASVDSVLEHTAKITFGNSGGPLVNGNGEVVGVNYAAFQDVDQNLAIGTEVAQPIVSTLRQGQNQEYIGINAVAVESPVPLTPDGINRALHVISVQTGSPAFNAGIRAGDLILRVENTRAVRPAEEALLPTKEFYCDVLRTQGSTNPIAVQVLRAVPGQQSGGLLLEGVVNGQPLQVVGTVSPQETPYGSFTTVSDNSGVINVEVPTAWNDVQSTTTEIGPAILVSPNVNDYLNSWDVPGFNVLVTDQVGTDTAGVLDALSFTGCGSVNRSSVSNATLSGQQDRYEGCGPASSTTVVNFAMTPADGSYMAVGNVQLVSQRDEEALRRILQSLSVTGFGGSGGQTTAAAETTTTSSGTETDVQTSVAPAVSGLATSRL
jgi:serine protease Do